MSSITCGPEIIAEISPLYTAENLEDPFQIANLSALLSIEELEGCSAPGPGRPPTPYSMDEFKAQVDGLARLFETDQIRFEIHTKGEMVATTAIISNGKSGDNRVERFMTHLSRNGEPCGTYFSYRKK